VSGLRGWWHAQSLRTRLVVAAAVAVLVGVAGVAGVGYLAVRHQLYGTIDDQLRAQANDLQQQADFFAGRGVPLRLRTRFGQVDGYVQVVPMFGESLPPPPGQDVTLPVTREDRAVARGRRGPSLRSTSIGGTPARMLTVQLVPGFALQVALPTTHVQDQLHRLARAFVGLAAGALALAVGLAWLLARRALAPVAQLTAATEEIATTRNLTTRIVESHHDELGRLAASFNTMLDALEQSVTAQRRLVADASHELRTPLASLRTNVEVLDRVDELSPTDRAELIAGIVGQLQEITDLVADVVELARGEEPVHQPHDVPFDRLVGNAVERARLHWPGVQFDYRAVPVTVRGVGARLDRAVANLLDNAGKFSDPGGLVEVTVDRDAVLRVRDHGPGIPDEALPHVFDRFYRADEARAHPGSGLGLAIVKQVADAHGGRVTLHNLASGGAVAELTLTPVIVAPAAGAAPVSTAEVLQG
jgi:two-component system sensor histidine kinase MprB